MHTSSHSMLSSAKAGEPEAWECDEVWSLLGSGLNYILRVGQESVGGGT